MGTTKSDKHQLLTRTCTIQTTSWLVHNLSTFGARMSHEQSQIHKIHHGPDLGGSHHLPPFGILYASPQGPHPNGILSQHSQMGVPKFPNLRLLQLWGPIILCADLRSRWSLEQSCISRQELSNSMSHTTCMQGNRGDSQLFVVGSQIANLTPSLSFGHNLCFNFQMGHASPFQTSSF
jgi:hypothetical protein